MAGFEPTTRQELDLRVGSLAVQLRDTLAGIQAVQVYFVSTADNVIQALTGSPAYTAGDVSAMKSAYTDLDKFANIYKGLATQSPAYNFETFAKRLYGVR